MTPDEYAADICSRVTAAKPIPFLAVSTEDWSPAKSACHENVNRWIKENAGCVAVRGWVTWYPIWRGIKLTAHSIVKDVGGRLFDITPVENEDYRRGMKFVPHVGDDVLFFDMVKLSHSMDCCECGDA